MAVMRDAVLDVPPESVQKLRARYGAHTPSARQLFPGEGRELLAFMSHMVLAAAGRELHRPVHGRAVRVDDCATSTAGAGLDALPTRLELRLADGGRGRAKLHYLLLQGPEGKVMGAPLRQAECAVVEDTLLARFQSHARLPEAGLVDFQLAAHTGGFPSPLPPEVGEGRDQPSQINTCADGIAAPDAGAKRLTKVII